MFARSYTLERSKSNGGNVKVDFDSDVSKVQVRLHRTTIVSLDRNTRKATLNTGGYRTVITKRAMNRFFELVGQPTRIYQKKFAWYIATPEGDKPFEDGVEVPIDHYKMFW